MGGKICKFLFVWYLRCCVSDTVDVYVYVVKVGAHFGRHPDVNSQLNYNNNEIGPFQSSAETFQHYPVICHLSGGGYCTKGTLFRGYC